MPYTIKSDFSKFVLQCMNLNSQRCSLRFLGFPFWRVATTRLRLSTAKVRNPLKRSTAQKLSLFPLLTVAMLLNFTKGVINSLRDNGFASALRTFCNLQVFELHGIFLKETAIEYGIKPDSDSQRPSVDLVEGYPKVPASLTQLLLRSHAA